MAVQFAKYERNESVLESQGTVKDLVGQDGFLELIPKNLQDVNKRVVVILKKKNGQSAMVTCSKPVSDGIRNKSIDLGHLINFEILEGDSGVPYISMPGGGLISVAIKSITAKDFVPTAVAYEDLI